MESPSAAYAIRPEYRSRRFSQRRRRGGRGAHSGPFPRLDHRRSPNKGISDFHFHVAAGARQGPTPRRAKPWWSSCVGRSPTASVWPPRCNTRRFPRNWRPAKSKPAGGHPVGLRPCRGIARHAPPRQRDWITVAWRRRSNWRRAISAHWPDGLASDTPSSGKRPSAGRRCARPAGPG